MHPLAALSEHEIKSVADLIRDRYPSPIEIHFKVITLQEPPKDQVLSYLEAEHATDGSVHEGIDRRAWINYYIKNTVCYAGVRLPLSG
jgi:primary-amine oxidase